MSMTAGISFFENSLSLFKNGASAAASSNNAAANLALGVSPYYKWESSGSDDSTTETYTVTLPSAVEFSRLFLLSHNFKAFTVQYGGTPSHFTGVRGLDGVNASGIVETANTRSTSYYEFNAVTTDTIVISIDTTLTMDAEKFLTQFIVTNEIGTLQGYPQLSGIGIDRNAEKQTSITGLMYIEKQRETRDFNLNLTSYPYQDDIDLLDGLQQRNGAFLVWPCGGRPDIFRLKQRGWRVEDVIPMQTDSKLQNGYVNNVYSLGVSQNYSFIEVIS